MTESLALRRAVLVVALANLAYFGVEFFMALAIGSVSLLSDSADFFEDAAVNLLIVIALGWSAPRRKMVGFGLAAFLLLPALAFLWSLWRKLSDPTPPQAIALSLTALGALAVNLSCAFLLARFRQVRGGLVKAAFLSARNDAFANAAIIAAGALTILTHSMWPDIIVGLLVAGLNIDAAREVLSAARGETDEPGPA